MTTSNPNGLTHAQVNHLLGDEGLPAARPATIRAWVKRGRVERAPDGGVDLPSLIEFIDARKKQIADEAARRRARDAPDRDQ